jgi:hypothetical protein
LSVCQPISPYIERESQLSSCPHAARTLVSAAPRLDVRRRRPPPPAAQTAFPKTAISSPWSGVGDVDGVDMRGEREVSSDESRGEPELIPREGRWRAGRVGEGEPGEHIKDVHHGREQRLLLDLRTRGR